MFCINCGNELMENANFCQNCGQKVPEMMSGNNEEIIVEELTDKVVLEKELEEVEYAVEKIALNDSIEFSINGETVYFDGNMRKYIEITSPLYYEANVMFLNYISLFDDEIKSLDNLLDTGINQAQKIILQMVNLGIDKIISLGILEYDFERIMNEYYSWFDFSRYLANLEERVSNVEETVYKLQAARQQQRASRSRWQGGGFGLSGAIKGAMMAGALNAGTSMFRGIGDGITNSSDRKKINKMKLEVLNNPDTRNEILSGIMSCTQGVIAAVVDVLYKSGVISYIELDANGCNSKFKNICNMIEKNTITQEKGLKSIIELVESYPNNVDFYVAIFTLQGDSNRELLKLAKYIGYEPIYLSLITDLCNTRWNQLKPNEDTSIEELKEALAIVKKLESGNPEFENQQNSTILDRAIENEKYTIDLDKELINSYNKNVETIELSGRLVGEGSLLEAFELVEKRNGYVEFLIENHYDYSLREAYNEYDLEEMNDEIDEILWMTDEKGEYTKKFAQYLKSHIIQRMYDRDSEEYKQAVQEIKRMSEQGVISAIGEIGNIEIQGHEYVGIQQNVDSGIKKWIEVGLKNNPYVLYKLGRFYRMGDRVSLNRRLSRVFLNHALELKFQEAETELKLLDKKNTSSSDSACFITTAVIKSLNVNDDGYELTQFRNFRDNWLINQSNGKAIVDEYYSIAPKIVSKIDEMNESKVTYKAIWDDYLNECLKLIELKDFHACKDNYIKMVRELENKYLNNEEIAYG